MLAYVFWHRPLAGADPAAYEERLAAFHEAIGVPSAWFRVSGLPWTPGAGYEDWYLVEDFTALGELNERAVTGAGQAPHDAAAAETGWGTGGLYGLRRGDAPLRGVRFAAWRSKPADTAYEDFEPALPGDAVWRRQMVLGPAPEYVLHTRDAPLDGAPSVEYRGA